MRHFEPLEDYSTIASPAARAEPDEAVEAAIDVAWDALIAFLPGWAKARRMTAWRRDLRAILAAGPIHDRSYEDAFAPDRLVRAQPDQRK